ncbi:MAG: hydrogenase 4 subunit F [Candidatus Methanomethylophilaceae archaeon]|nr:hydrogenase 4 subunit F [Candidatus Methanomethylophilaceae archaeon]
MMVSLLLCTPLLFALFCALAPSNRWIGRLSLLGLGLVLIQVLDLSYGVIQNGPLDAGMWYIDDISVIFLLLMAVISFLVGIYALSYIGHELHEGVLTPRDSRFYHVFIQLFLFTMLLVLVVDSLGLMWIAIESTTLASAFLVGFYKKEESLEAAWKYIMICSVGIALALMGVTLMYASSLDVFGDSSRALDWSVLKGVAATLDPTLLKLSFIFIIAGYGTKAGLAPMHTWLPDAHSQAPSPVSAMMSALLLNCAMYGIIRFHVITEAAVPGFSSSLLLGFGLVSVAVAALFISITTDLKRMLAYSSIEHMGIVAIALGIGGTWGTVGAVIHIAAHSLTKSMLFLSAGDIVQKYGTRDIASITGVLKSIPWSGRFFTAGCLGIVGLPPFPIFLGEAIIVYAALQSGDFLVAALFLVLLLMVFVAFTYRFVPMLGGDSGLEPSPSPLSRLLPMGILLIMGLALGLVLPGPVLEFLQDVAAQIGGVL